MDRMLPARRALVVLITSIVGVVALLGSAGRTEARSGELWVRRLNGPANGSDSATSLAVSPDGGVVYVTGTIEGTDSDVDIATVAYQAATGARVWMRRSNGPGNSIDVAHSIAASPDGVAVYVTGSTLRDDFYLEDTWTLSLDGATGTRRWVESYTGFGWNDVTLSVAISPDGETVYVAGTRQINVNDNDFLTVAYGADTGMEVWVAQYDGGFYDGGSDVAVSPDGSRVYVTGSSDYDYATVAYDADTGDPAWISRYDGPGTVDDDSAHSIVASPDGTMVYVTGESTGPENDAVVDYATVGYDAGTGDQAWVSRYKGPGNGYDRAYSIAISPDGATVFVTGSSDAFGTGADYATVAYDGTTGAQVWARRYDGPGHRDDSAWSVAVSPDGATVYVTGGSTGADLGSDFATLAYDAATGARIWQRRYLGPQHGSDVGQSVAVSPDGAIVFVTGHGGGPDSGNDWVTVAYST